MQDELSVRSDLGMRALLQDLLVVSAGLEEFLEGLVAAAASNLSEDDTEVLTSVTLLRPRAKITIASSCTTARWLADLQYRVHEGPCMRAASTGETVSVADFASDTSSPLYSAAALEHGIRSGLGVPVELGGPERAAVNYYSPAPDAFPQDTVHQAEHFAAQASTPLRLALRVARLTERAEHLTAAMESRTTIDLAAGVIMAQNRCSQEDAIDILRTASAARSIKLRDLAAQVLTNTIDAPVSTHFD